MSDAPHYGKVPRNLFRLPAFKRLSLPGKAAYLALLTGPHTTALPGLADGDALTLASALGCAADEAERLMGEIEAAGLVEVDREASVYYLPHAVGYERCASWQTLTAWWKCYQQIPASPVKVRFVAGLRAACDFDAAEMAAKWRTTFGTVPAIDSPPPATGCPSDAPRMPMACPPHALPIQQEQEQEQEQEHFSPIAPSGGGAAAGGEGAQVLRLTLAEPAPAARPEGKEPRPTIRDRVLRHLRAASELLAELSAARQRVYEATNETARPLRPTWDNLSGIAERLDAGASAEEVRHVIAVREAECRADPSHRRWFDAVTPFRAKNFARTMACNPADMTARAGEGRGRPRARAISDWSESE